MRVLLLTVHFKPNLGGVETHLNDLVNVLSQKGLEVIVLAYRPLVVKEKWSIYQKENGNVIIRIPWLPSMFYKLVSFPALEFIYLIPGLFLVSPFVLLFNSLDVIHAHGLIAGFVGVFWGKIFKKRIIVSLHNIYHFPKNGFYRHLAKWIFQNADHVSTLSKLSVNEVVSLGVPSSKVSNFTYWIDLNKFKRIPNAKSLLKLDNKFTVFFAGRLVSEKGLIVLLDSVKLWNKQIYLIIAGTGPLEEKVKEAVVRFNNIKFVGSLTQEQLPIFYSASDILIVPSTSEEGFGRVIIESLACGTPVIGAKRGAIPEAMDQTVGRLIDISTENIKNTVEFFYSHTKELEELSKNCRSFAERRYSEKNAESIIKSYAR